MVIKKNMVQPAQFESLDPYIHQLNWQFPNLPKKTCAPGTVCKMATCEKSIRWAIASRKTMGRLWENIWQNNGNMGNLWEFYGNSQWIGLVGKIGTGFSMIGAFR